MWVKICANTNLEDALLAAEFGADAVGFVFAPSKRQVTASQVGLITTHLPDGLERVGVFPAWSAGAIADAVREAGLTTVQLHGGLDLDLIRALDEQFEGAVRIIQTLHWTTEDSLSKQQVAERLMQIFEAKSTDRVLIDSKVGAVTGGTGVIFDWTAAQSVFTSSPEMRLILAGGLRPENVGDAIAQLRPWGVDVASGVESVPGRKDAAKMKQFIERAKASGPASSLEA